MRKETKVLTAEETVLALKRYSNGESLKVIAIDLGVTISAISYLAKRHGLKPRKPRKHES